MQETIKKLQNLHRIVGRQNELMSALVAARANKHILLEGPVGVGKTTIALAVASHLERGFIRIDGDERYTEQKLAGWYDPPLVLQKGYTEESFIRGPLANAMEQGAILLINELNRMPEGTQNVMLSAMDEKTIFIPKHGRVDAADGFMIIATQNPDEYIGTSQLSEALKDRFICVDLNYQSEDDERNIVGLRSVCEDENTIRVAVVFARMTRNNEEIRRGSSIRGAIDLADMFSTSFGPYSPDPEKWLTCARLAFMTKIELHDYSNERFEELMRKLAQRSIQVLEQSDGAAPADSARTRLADMSIEEKEVKKK